MRVHPHNTRPSPVDLLQTRNASDDEGAFSAETESQRGPVRLLQQLVPDPAGSFDELLIIPKVPRATIPIYPRTLDVTDVANLDLSGPEPLDNPCVSQALNSPTHPLIFGQAVKWNPDKGYP